MIDLDSIVAAWETNVRQPTADESLEAFRYLLAVHALQPLPQSRERRGPLSNAEIRRWLDQKAVEINGVRAGPKDVVTLPVQTLVFFPKGAARTTYL